ncbi:head-tail connector protein [Pseudomonas sp. NY11955]|uniref:head-tail connector protein n=1 Tax=Pseudomonas sp. NY11955 TaxID=3400363 RepID=UPI003A87D395
MGLQLLEAPTAQPVSLEVAKKHLRIAPDDTDQDDEVARIVRAATAWAERITQRALCQQRWRLHLDGFPCGAVLIPRPPLQSVEAVNYTDSLGSVQTLDALSYIVNPFEILGRVSLAQGESWPATRKQAMSVKIDFTAGYATVPEDIVSAILLLVGHLDQNREQVVTGTIATELPMGVDSLLAPYCVPGVP